MPAQLRASTKDVVAIDNAITAEPVQVLVEHRRAQLLSVGIALGGLAQQRLDDDSRNGLIAMVEQVNPVHGQGCFRGGVELFAGVEEVHAGHLLRLADTLGRLGVERQVLVVLGAVGKHVALEIFMGDG